MKRISIIITIIIIFAGIDLWSLIGEDRNFLGFWTGTLRISEAEVELNLEFVMEKNELKGFITVPIQMMRDFSLSNLRIDYPDIYFELESGVIAKFTGSMKEGYISGTFSQPGGSGLFHVVRGEKQEIFAEKEREKLKGETEVYIATRFGNIHGSLVVPELDRKMPVVLIIAGSGPTDRDGNNPMFGEGRIYRNLAQKLYEHGIASLRFDKRGIAASSQAMIKEEDLRILYFVQDVIQWMQKLKDDERFSEIAVFGHSEGSLIGLIAANNEPVDGFISAAGAGRNIADVIEEQMQRQPEPYRTEAIEILESLRNGFMVQEVREELRPLFRNQIQPYLLSVFLYDPAQEIAKLDIPVLIVQGENDIQTSVEDARLLAQANPKAKLRIISNMNHVFRNSSKDPHETIISYSNAELPFNDTFLSALIDFVNGLR